MRLVITIAFVLVGLNGCGKSSTSISESCEAVAKQEQLVVGEKQVVDIVVRYRRNERAAAAQLKYKVELSSPDDLTVEPATWEFAWDLDANSSGHDHAYPVTIRVVEGAAPGERVVTVKMTPERDPARPWTSALKFQVVKNSP